MKAPLDENPDAQMEQVHVALVAKGSTINPVFRAIEIALAPNDRR
jgi:hypothetical protein